ncbi:MAG TPA: hypothetical protein VGI75_04560 [Pirellulales bacterium]|jgi:transcriptional regulator with XRE-family HTH domain
MLPPAIVEEARRLLGRGELSQRKIAAMLKISRGSIGAIALGRRPDYPPPDEAEDEHQNLQPPVRCRGCGGLVYAPCRLCRVRAAKARQLAAARLQLEKYFRRAG